MISKEARITEEVVVRKEAEQHTGTVSNTVRETKVELEDERSNKVSGDRHHRPGLTIPIHGSGTASLRVQFLLLR